MKLKKLFAVMALTAISATAAFSMGACAKVQPNAGEYFTSKSSYKVGVCQLVQHAALDAATQGFVETLQAEVEKAGKTVEINIQNANGDSANCSVIATTMVAAETDLILANATPALQACASATQKIPVLGTSITEYADALGVKTWKGGTNISGTSDLAPLDKQADMFTELLPNAKKVGILYCSSEANSKFQAKTITPYLQSKGITVKTYSFSDSNDISSVINKIIDEMDAMYIPTDNAAASNTELINNICSPRNFPIIAGEEGIAKGCGIATLSISYYNLGVKTAKMASRILLEGENVANMAIEYDTSPVYKYNAAKCEQLGITPSSNYEAL